MVFLIIGTTAAMLVAAAGTAIGGIAKAASARKARQRQKAALQRQRDEENAWYARKINEDFLQRAESQAALERVRKTYQRTIDEAQGRMAVMGGTNAAAAAQQEAANEAYGNAVAQIAGNASATKDKVEESHRNAEKAMTDKEMDLQAQEDAAKADAIDTATNTINSAATAYLAGSTGTTGAKDLKAANDATKAVTATNLPNSGVAGISPVDLAKSSMTVNTPKVVSSNAFKKPNVTLNTPTYNPYEQSNWAKKLGLMK